MERKRFNAEVLADLFHKRMVRAGDQFETRPLCLALFQ